MRTLRTRSRLGGELLVIAREPSCHSAFVVLRKATLARPAWQIRPSLIGAEVGDEVIRRRESRLACRGLQDVALKRGRMIAGHRIPAAFETEHSPNPMTAKEAIREVKVVHARPRLIVFAVHLFRCASNQFALVASMPPN